MLRRLTSAGAFLALGMASETAVAAMICADHALLAEVLDARQQERQRAIGFTNRGELLELYAGVDGRWTVLMTGADGGACIVEDGEAWEAVPASPGA